MTRWALAAVLGASGCGEFVLVRDGQLGGAAPLAVSADLSGASMLRYYSLQGVLSDNVVASGRDHEVLYSELLGDDEGLGTVQFTLGQLAGVDPLVLDTRAERFAFFMNLYNLGVLSGVLGELQADPSYRTVSSDNFLFFQTPRVSLGGHAWTLDQLEHGIMRGDPDALIGLDDDQLDLAARWFDALWDGGPVDARLHVGVNCSARSCPNLLMEPFRADRLDDQLDDAAVTFVNDPVKGAGPDGISELFTWFEDDFRDGYGSPRAFVEAYRTDGTADVDFDARLPYDWSLNGR